MRGKSFELGGQKLFVRGVSYGTFRPGPYGDLPDPARVAEDLSAMAEAGINVVRTYSPPPEWFLDDALAAGLRVFTGAAWEQHIAFLDERDRCRSIERRVREAMERVAGHPALLCFAVGNEIPSSIVRWHGPRRVERFLERLYAAAKEVDADSIATYVNYPSTEYLQLPFLDVVAFNVFLEQEERLEAYVARLQNIAGDRPLLVSEIGLDSARHGERAQADAVGWQVRTAFRGGCAGTVVFSWTDDWHRGGHDVEGWRFGLTDRERRPKPALYAVAKAYAEAPLTRRTDWPRVSVLVCSHNGAATLRECLAGVAALDYPDFETIVVDDGSTDATAAIAEEFDVRLLRTENRGLSAARNTALDAATGEIVAYTDDDAWPDPHWLQYLVSTLCTTAHAGCGGPNIPPADSRATAEAVARAPGGPTHVLLSDAEAEHIPGCNMAFWRRRLQAIGGFDEQFRVAGDDVDISWRLQQCRWTLGFSAGAVVWHRRRGSVRAFLRQQYEYGKAEALLGRKWPDRYNRGGHLTWAGRVYGSASPRPWRRRRWRVYYGPWGSGPFQPLEQHDAGVRGALLAAMHECYLAIAGLAGLSALGAFWRPLLLALPLLVASVALVVAQAAVAAARAQADRPGGRALPISMRGLTVLLYLVQPLARLGGRLGHGLAPWRRPRGTPIAVPRIGSASAWFKRWRRPEASLEAFEALLLAKGVVTSRGGVYDRWDLQARGGLLGACRLRSAVEDHSAGKQLLRVRFWPNPSRAGITAFVVLGSVAVLAGIEHAWAANAALATAAVAIGGWVAHDCAIATGAVVAVLRCDLEETTDRAAVRAIGPRPAIDADWSASSGVTRKQEAVG